MRKHYFVDLFKTKADVKREFTASSKDFEGVDIILAWYSYEDYSGDAEVIF